MKFTIKIIHSRNNLFSYLFTSPLRLFGVLFVFIFSFLFSFLNPEIANALTKTNEISTTDNLPSTKIQSVNLFNLNKNYKGFINIESKELYVEYWAPKNQMPTVVLLNGLTYSTKQWHQMVLEFSKWGFGILTYDMNGMGNTLLKYGIRLQPYPYLDQVHDLNQLLMQLGLPSKINIVGLSYGGGIASAFANRFPNKINKLILMAPYTEPLATQDQFIRKQIDQYRKLNPLAPFTEDDLYDYYLKIICYSTYPSAEPSVLENPIKLEAVFRMTQGIRKFNASLLTYNFPKNSIYLLIAEKDQYIPAEVLEKFWISIPNSAKGEKIYIKDSEHKIPESKPIEAVKIISDIITRRQ